MHNSTQPTKRSHPFAIRVDTLLISLALIGAGCRSGADDVGEDEVMHADETTQSDTDSSEESADSNATDSDTGEPDFTDYHAPGPLAVGTTSFTLIDGDGERDLLVQLWYPTTDTSASESITAFVPRAPDASTFAELVTAAPEGCTRKQTNSAFHVAPDLAAGAPWPTVLFSHCHTCTRFSSYSLAERLASHGFLVAAVDHSGNTLFDLLAGEPLPVDVATLELRVSDMRRLLDELLDSQAQSLPSEFVGAVDGERVGVFGHSFGSVTTGRLLQDDDRFAAGVAIAAPLENPLLPGVSLAAIDEPILFMVAVEDNSITELGNQIIRTNFAQANVPVWKLELADAGHWSFSDICNLVPDFQPGCGMGQRQTNPDESFTYLDPELARELTAGRVTAFFAHTLRGEPDARDQLEQPDREGVLDIDARE